MEFWREVGLTQVNLEQREHCYIALPLLPL